MQRRLQLAKSLLCEEGVIFVSIDDNEQAYLKVLMDEIFGEDNFVGNINWQSSFGGKNDTKLMPVNTEYILFYGNRTKQLLKLKNNNIKKINSFTLKDENYSKYGKFKISPLCWSSLTYYKNLDYIIYIEKHGNKLLVNNKRTSYTIGKSIAGPSSVDWSTKEKMWKNRQEGLSNKNDWRFYWSWDVLVKAFEAKFICIKKVNENYVVYKKEYEKAKFSGRDKDIILRDYENYCFKKYYKRSKNFESKGNLELRSISEDFDFSYPKPTSLLKKLFSTKSKDAVILDFLLVQELQAMLLWNSMRKILIAIEGLFWLIIMKSLMNLIL